MAKSSRAWNLRSANRKGCANSLPKRDRSSGDAGHPLPIRRQSGAVARGYRQRSMDGGVAGEI